MIVDARNFTESADHIDVSYTDVSRHAEKEAWASYLTDNEKP